MLDKEFRMLVRTTICQKKIIYRQPIAHLVRRGVEPDTKRDTREYVASSPYAVECPIPLKDPAVASERCASKPLSERPTFITRRSNTRRFDKKSDELCEARRSTQVRYVSLNAKHVLIGISIDV
jgi:hypothetical protein